MKHIIAGGTGFIGKALAHRWLKAGNQVAVIGRSRDKIKQIFHDKVTAITWSDLTTKGHGLFENAKVVVNLAGANISAKRWSEEEQHKILQSRTKATHQLATLCAELGNKSPALFSADGVGVYGPQQPIANGLPTAFDEDTAIDLQKSPSFLAKVGREWETATETAVVAGVRVVNMRFGVVLAKKDGVLPQMSRPFLFFMGGPIGSGQQPFSWISLTDLCDAIDFVLERTNATGPINFVAPEGITQKQFAVALGQALNRPAIITTPVFVLKILFGKMADELLLSGQNVYPKRLLQLGFKFKYPEINQALKAIYD